ncbi:MAG: DUF4350 domain-containing protein [Acidobacteriota bacterium]
MGIVKRYAALAGLLLLIIGYALFIGFPGRPGIHLTVWITGGMILALAIYWNQKTILSFLQGRAMRSGASAFLYTAVVLAIWVLVNLIAREHHKRIDFTEEGSFTLASQTIKILENLPRPVEISVFLDEQQAGSLQDLLNEYKYYGRDLSIRYVDPLKNPQEVRRFDVTQAGTLVFESGDQQTRITRHEEEEITNALLKVTRDRKKVVYFTRGHGEREIDDFESRGVSQARDVLAKQLYEVQDVQLAQEEKVPEDATVLVVAGPEAPFLEMEAAMVREWVLSGGHLLVLADPERQLGLDSLLEEFGIRVHDDRIINISPISQLMGFDALVPIGNEYVSHPITEDLRVATFYPDASSVELIEEGSGPGIQNQYLVMTDENSWAERNPEEIKQGRVQLTEGEDLPGPVAIAAVSSSLVEAEENPGEISGEPDANGGDPAENPPRESRLVVFGDSDFASNQFFNLQGNGDLFLNVIGWLAEEEDLISIRPKSPTSRTLILSGRQARVIFYSSVLGPFGTFLVLGFWVWWRRRKL